MNPGLEQLRPYPFEKLAQLKAGVRPPEDLEPVSLAMGEPQAPPPPRVLEILATSQQGYGRYPATRGLPEFRETVVAWLRQRYGLGDDLLDPGRHVLPVNGTREALFAFAQCVLARDRERPLVMMPNPFYQIYEGAAYLAGLEPWYHTIRTQSDIDAIPARVWDRCQMIYLCTPANPSGGILAPATLQALIELAHRHDFLIACDECYSEIYADDDQPPLGLLAASAACGNDGFSRCMVFHSLSKRSNLPGLRSGFVAGDATLIDAFLRYRTYHGCAMSIPVQLASIAAWSDEAHVEHNRADYRDKFAAVEAVLGDVWDARPPGAGFYLWPVTPGDDVTFAQRLYERTNVTVLPGQFLSRATPDGDPGAGHVRLALVPELDVCVEAATRIRSFLLD